MKNTAIEFFKSDKGALWLLLGVTALVLLFGLGARELWGAETRWANISLQMLQSGDYFDPYLKGSAYYDKPLPSYWLIAATAELMGGLSHWSLRLSSVVAAWLSVWLIYLIGRQLFTKSTGLIAGWMLATTFFFIFWGRVATADILTVCGVLASVWWYWRGPDDTRLGRYTVFFLLLAVTSLFKGLIGFILPALVLLPHVLSEGRWKRHLNLRMCLALIIACLFYMAPFVLSHIYGAQNYRESGLGLVFQENFVRFFHPFDNLGPIYTYLIYLPVYTLPWAPCWILGLWVAARQWRQIEPNTRWLIMGLGLLFLFFTASGSRRSYYVLPLVPFAQLIGAWWVTRFIAQKRAAGKVSGPGWVKGFAAAAGVLFLVLGVIYPWTNGGGGVVQFSADVRGEATKSAPWDQWRMVLVEVDNKLPMYLQNEGGAFYYVTGSENIPQEGDSAAFMAWIDKASGQHWNPERTIIVAQYHHHGKLPLNFLAADHTVITTQLNNGARLFHSRESGSVAFIPQAVSTVVENVVPAKAVKDYD
ncbi:glycosyltransferase family 39 protein [Pseudomonas sp. 10B1]|uniref:ArnT family glycosyltransferase n=1 Tax=unclassified Pseudomonas TaxID=196821 RepID=UPI002AB3D310|nr:MULTISPECIES: glycosyltransferase family 39 protein [unclassified Pseudomonas]MDY7561078.1 glycosyltransferase family 39 protein [Pseudomonas sp. AB6]MEA9979816.1 glycosyltransferase family 39 protein [Pseudomonas sp. RTS4]MEA9997401.1 glycosyltransferase family 39 protein [Pseudomonas sp. AA4]MEB0089371.1 glycosyltransferase family 39 protein [Pseudomonas sp. RTI1]MEB0128543.1 glycosyltransferase family 39 protein [Pseudomonas sp. CCC1.2]